MEIKIEKQEQTFKVHSPYNSEWVSVAKRLNGKWDAKNKTWEFKNDLLNEVENCLYDIYGYGGDLLDVDVVITDRDFSYQKITFPNGATVERKYRDDSVSLRGDLVLLDGAFKSCGGSRANPVIGEVSNVKIRLYSVPENRLEEIEEYGDATVIEKKENGKYSSYTKEQLKNIKSIELDKIKVKGKDELVTIYKPVTNLMENYDSTSKKKVKTSSKKDNKK